ncbi:MAG: bifunctional precorrin-2 dehydrogenase/sirohydrochlorin ferrochelatase [Bacteroidales bacterium]|jgi:precorrin-2 dehydrogenase/sirohydrochlorin ferrochelatase
MPDNKIYLPVFLDITNKSILIIGGGKIAEQKLFSISAFTDKITILSKEINDNIKKTNFKKINKEYNTVDLYGFYIVYACTNNKEINAQIKSDAAKLNILVNVVDDPSLCDFISPAIYKEENITVAVSSSGTNVKKAIEWRNRIKKMFEKEEI